MMTFRTAPYSNITLLIDDDDNNKPIRAFLHLSRGGWTRLESYLFLKGEGLSFLLI